VLPWRTAAAQAHAAQGRIDAARELAQEQLASARRFGAPRALGGALRVVAVLGPDAERIDAQREAVSVLEASEARLAHAHALCDLGASLRRAGARREGREPLRLALDLALSSGAAALARRARDELAASGARPRRLRSFGRDALTPAELRVAQLAVEGLSNREIAQALFVTLKTVETHLSSSYAKLGIHVRGDLCAALASEQSPGAAGQIPA
jgi:DNA-binding CsgD family transcriptional regulator